jgi:glyoxylase-like metal-dependent hydrolase (beta-lactamase superfamily II)
LGRILGGVGVALIFLIGAGAVYVHDRITSLESERVSDDVHAIFGVGGNVAVLRTDIGAVVVDTMLFRLQGERIRELAERLTGGPIQVLVNTHYHRDHTHGNPGFAPGTRLVATERTVDYLHAFDASYWEGRRAESLPNDLVAGEHEMRIGSKTIRSLHLGRGHTGGDLVVLFVEDRVLHAGDLFFHGRYPRVDLPAGGSLREWVETLDRVLELDFERVIPGQGPVSDREGLRGFQRFLREVQGVAARAASEGLSLDEMLARAQLSEDEGYEPGGLPPLAVFERDDVLRWAWEEATGSVVPEPVPRRGGGEQP